MPDHEGRISSDDGDPSRHQAVELDHGIIDNDLRGRLDDEVTGMPIRYDDEHGVEIVKFEEIATTTSKYDISVNNCRISTIDSNI